MLNFIASAVSDPGSHDTVVSDLPIPDMEQGGYAINLIAAVRDHAPARIDEIQRSIRDLQSKIQQMQIEERLLSRLLAVVTQEGGNG